MFELCVINSRSGAIDFKVGGRESCVVLVARFIKITIKGFRELIVQEFVHGFAIFNLNKNLER